jgi:RNA polymerase sigma-70 factor (ECF subfamily)
VSIVNTSWWLGASKKEKVTQKSGPVTFWAVATLYTEMVNSATGSSTAFLPQTAQQSDEEVVEQVLAGNTALFELLMRRYNARLYRAARAITRDDREAEDVLQQAYVNAFSNLRQFRGQAQFATWLTRITINEALARVRRRGRYEPFDDDLSNVETFMPWNALPDPERQAFTGELRELLEGAIDSLPDGAREVFVLRDVEGLSTAETAASLDVSEDVVKTRLSRARAALRRSLLERVGATAPDAFRFYRPRCDRVVAQVLARIAGTTPLA